MTLRPVVRRIVRAWAAEAGGAPIFVFGRWRGSPQRLRGNLEGTLPCRSHWREAPATCDLRPANAVPHAADHSTPALLFSHARR